MPFFKAIIDDLSTWKTVSISSTVLCINNTLLAVTSNQIIEVTQLIFQLLISGATLTLVIIKIRNELKNKAKNEDP
jgi:hypothetical protein